jgi:hypothetical protein
MNTKKKILFIVSGIIFVCLIIYGGIYLYARSRPLVKCPCNVKVQLPLQTDMITGWQVFLYGKIADINSEKMVLISRHKTETAIVKLIPGEKGTVYQNAFKPVGGENSLINLKDLKVGDYVSVRADVSKGGDEYLARWIAAFIKPTQ